MGIYLLIFMGGTPFGSPVIGSTWQKQLELDQLLPPAVPFV